jgi:DNA ligase (NAD+)
VEYCLNNEEIMSKTAESDIKKRIKDLEKVIIALDTAFEVGNDCVNPLTNEVVLDNEYDALKRELFNLKPTSKIFKTVTASKAKLSKDKIIHDPPMTSINKCNGTQEEKDAMLKKWMEDCLKNNPNKTVGFVPGKLDFILAEKSKMFTMSYKHDGLALSCEYEKGELKRVGLRSKSGMDGINVTDKAKYIAGIPQTLKSSVTCKVRGEVETAISDFERVSAELGADAKANPRAHTAGSMNQKTAEKMKDRGLRFTAYNVVDIENPPYKTEIGRAKWTSKQGFHFVKTFPFSYQMLKTFEDNHRRLDFMVDGAVISVSDLELQKQMGTSGNKATGNPKGKIAFKFKDEVKNAVVKDITWQTGRTGNITPVLIFDGIQLEGTTVCKCTAHNLGMIKSNKIGIGSEIEIIKSGKIIPKIHKVVKAKGTANIPTECPSCGGVLEEVDGANDALSLVCNGDFCPAQNIKNLNHWFKILGAKGIAGSTIEKLIDAGVVQKPGDFYRLTVQGLLDVGFTKRTAMLIVARVWMINAPEQMKDEDTLMQMIGGATCVRIKTTMAKFFAAFGMKNAGREAGRILEKEIGGWDEIKNATVDELEAFDGIGGVMAQEIVQFFTKNEKMVEDVEQYFRFAVPKSGGKLDGKTFVLSGSLDGGKSKWKNAIEGLGGTVKGSVGRKIDYLVAGDGSGAKSEKAEELGIKILTVKDLEKML